MSRLSPTQTPSRTPSPTETPSKSSETPFSHHYKTSTHYRNYHNQFLKRNNHNTTITTMEQKNNDKIRLIIQFLKDSGFTRISKLLEEESNCLLESERSKIFKEHIINGNWNESIEILPLLEGIQTTSIPLIILKIKKHYYYELLLTGKLAQGIQHLKSKDFCLSIKEANEDPLIIKEMASLVPIGKMEIMKKMSWSEEMDPRTSLFNDIIEYLPASLFIPKNRFDEIIFNSLEMEKLKCHRKNPLIHLLNDQDQVPSSSSSSSSFLFKHHCDKKELEIYEISYKKLEFQSYSFLYDGVGSCIMVFIHYNSIVSALKWNGISFITIELEITDDYEDIQIELFRSAGGKVNLILLSNDGQFQIFELADDAFVCLQQKEDFRDDEIIISALNCYVLFKECIYISSSNPPLLAKCLFPSMSVQYKRQDIRIDDMIVCNDVILMMDNSSNLFSCLGDINSLEMIDNIPLSINRFGNQEDPANGIIVGGIESSFFIINSQSCYSKICQYKGSHKTFTKSITMPSLFKNGLIIYPDIEENGLIFFYDREDGSKIGQHKIDRDQPIMTIHPIGKTSFITIDKSGGIGVYQLKY